MKHCHFPTRVVLAQMRVEEKGNEITHAPKLLSQLDLRGVLASGDAIFDQRDLSLKIVQANGDYLWTVKGNQEGLRQDIEVLFQPHRKRAGTSAQLRLGHAPQILTMLNNTVLGLFARQGQTNVAHAGREFAYQFDKALATLAA